MTKICKKCKKKKSIRQFWKDETHRDGRCSCCKDCRNLLRREQRKQDPEKYSEFDKEHYEKYKEMYDRQSKQRYLKNPKKIIKRIQEWKKNNPKRVKASQKRTNTKYRSTMKGKLHNRIAQAIYLSLKGNKNNRSWTDLVPYTLDQLAKHLKKTLPTGYTWQDYLNGKLHLDHKIPIRVFNFKTTKDIDFKRCWALSNLQLLPIKDNLSKGAKLNEHFQPSLAFGG